MDAKDRIIAALQIIDNALGNSADGSCKEVDALIVIRDQAYLIDEALAELDKAQQPAEPVAWMHPSGQRIILSDTKARHAYTPEIHREYPIPLYAHPPQAQQPAAGLTVFEITEVVREWVMERGEIAPEKFNVMEWLEEVEYLDARLTAALEAKTSTA